MTGTGYSTDMEEYLLVGCCEDTYELPRGGEFLY